MFHFWQPFVLFSTAQRENPFLNFLCNRLHWGIKCKGSALRRLKTNNIAFTKLIGDLMFTVRDYTTQTNWIIDFLILQSNGRSWYGTKKQTKTPGMSSACHLPLTACPRVLCFHALFAIILYIVLFFYVHPCFVFQLLSNYKCEKNTS